MGVGEPKKKPDLSYERTSEALKEILKILDPLTPEERKPVVLAAVVFYEIRLPTPGATHRGDHDCG